MRCRFDRLGVYGAFGLPIFLLVIDIVLRLLIVEKSKNWIDSMIISDQSDIRSRV